MTRNKLLWISLFITISLVTTTSFAVEYPPLPRTDEASRDESFVVFRDRLLQIIKFREPERLVELIDGRVGNGVGEPAGMNHFSKYWRIDATDSPLWLVLDQIVQNGGAYVREDKGTKFCAPYVFTDFPEGLDASRYVAVIAEGAPLLRDPRPNAETVTSVGRVVLELAENIAVKDAASDTVWWRVKLLEGGTAFVDSQSIRSPMDYRACFLNEEESNKWRLVSLEKG